MDNGEVRLDDGVVKRLAVALGYTDYDPYLDSKYISEAVQVITGLSLPKKQLTKRSVPTRKNELISFKDIGRKLRAV